MRPGWNSHTAALDRRRNVFEIRVTIVIVTSMEVSPRPVGLHDVNNQLPPLPGRKLVDVRRWSQEKNSSDKSAPTAG